jgi:PhzF family phenazine biosynthesis protein
VSGAPAPARRGRRRVAIHQLDVFTRRALAGNAAGVVPDARGLSARQMLAIARELNNSETAFVVPAPRGAGHDVRVRFFTPTREVPSCAHATLATHAALALEADAAERSLVQRTLAGPMRVDARRTAWGYHVVMTQRPPAFRTPLGRAARGALLTALGVGEGDLAAGAPVQWVTTGHAKIIVSLRRRTRLTTLAPDFRALVRLAPRLGAPGFFVFTLDAPDAGMLATARMFAPAIGIDEDPVTGNGHGPLGAYLARHGLVSHDGATLRFRASQGHALGRRGVAHVAVALRDGAPAEVRVGGDVVEVFRTELAI